MVPGVSNTIVPFGVEPFALLVSVVTDLPVFVP